LIQEISGDLLIVIFSHLLARRGLAERIGNLVGRLKFSDDQLKATQKGLKDAGVAMPNFGNVGKELAKEINEEPELDVETEEEREYCFLTRRPHALTSILMVKFVTDCFWRTSPQSLQYSVLRAAFSLAKSRLRNVSAYVSPSVTCPNFKHTAEVSWLEDWLMLTVASTWISCHGL
jgi:Ras GTPase-activating-like protein IQGAP2/3